MWSVGKIGSLSSVGCAGHVVCPVQLPEQGYWSTVRTKCNRLHQLLPGCLGGHFVRVSSSGFTCPHHTRLYMYLGRAFKLPRGICIALFITTPRSLKTVYET